MSVFLHLLFVTPLRAKTISRPMARPSSLDVFGDPKPRPRRIALTREEWLAQKASQVPLVVVRVRGEQS
jgi:hypothetical protein